MKFFPLFVRLPEPSIYSVNGLINTIFNNTRPTVVWSGTIKIHL